MIRKAFNATEEDFVQLVMKAWLSRPQIAAVGSCCLVGAISNEVLYVANLGDSRAVLGRRVADGRAVVAERLSNDHNVAEEEVRKELFQQHPDDSHIVVHTQGVWRIKGIIQVHAQFSLSLCILQCLRNNLRRNFSVFFIFVRIEKCSSTNDRDVQMVYRIRGILFLADRWCSCSSEHSDEQPKSS